MVFNYVSINSIISRLNIGGGKSIGRGAIIEWGADALDLVLYKPLLEQAVVFLPVVNHKGNYNKRIIDIIQVARFKYNGDVINLLHPKNNEQCQIAKKVCPAVIIENIPEAEEPTNCYCGVLPKAEAITLNYAAPYLEMNVVHESWFRQDYYMSNFEPVKLTTNTMFNFLAEFPKASQDFSNKLEYNISYPNIITSFKEGYVAMSIIRHKVDEKGYPMVPDDVNTLEAIKYYILWKYYENMTFDDNTNKNRNNRDYALEMYDYYMGLSRSSAMNKALIDNMENFTQANKYLLPNDYSYNNFFGDISSNYG